MICRFLVPLQCLHRFDLLSLTEQRIVRIGAEIASLRGTDGDRHGHVFPCGHVLLAVGPGFSVCLFELQQTQPKEYYIWAAKDIICRFDHMRAPQDVRYLDVCMRIPSSKHTWVSVCCSRVCIHVGLRDHFGFGLSSFKATPVQLSVWQNLQHGSLRLTCACLRALGPCLLGNALLCGHHSKSCCRKHSTEAVFAGTVRADGGAGRRWGCPWRHESRHLHHWHHRAWDRILVCQHQRLLQPMRRPE